MKQQKKKSFKSRLLVYFCLVSIIPFVIVNIVTYYNIAIKVQKNVDELKTFSLEQTKRNVVTVLSSYEDLLYQLYTDDDIVALVDKIDAGTNIAVSRNQLRRKLGAVAMVKSYIQSITVITENGSVVFYDKMASPTKYVEWIDRYGISTSELYKRISATNSTEILSTKYAAKFNSQSYYLFHMTHRIIDYKQLEKKNGVIIVSVDERMLNEICRQNIGGEDSNPANNLYIILDDTGNVISFEDSGKIGTKIIDVSSSQKQQADDLSKLVRNSGLLPGKQLKVYRIYDENLHWYFVNVSDQSYVGNELKNQQKLTFLTIILSVSMLMIIIYFITNSLTGSIAKIVKAMKRAERGELTVRVEADEHMPIEIETIAHQFNSMLEELNTSIAKEKEASLKQKNAEISALEAQINPHFLYNTLDTINWMAIDKEEYEISNSINALANILRYGVDKSNSVVEIKQEIDWLKKYVFLQQTRLKNTFECVLHANPEVLPCHIHKLLLQPFVENAIIHGFEGIKRKHILEINIEPGVDTVKITISDNGKGIANAKLQEILNGLQDNKDEKNHIGIANAIGRLHMYYGNQAVVQINSKLGEGTSIYIEIPKL